MSVMNDAKGPGLEDVAPGSAQDLRRALVFDALIDETIAQAGDQGGALTGEGGLLPELVKAVLERGLAVELDDHLGYARMAGPILGDVHDDTLAKLGEKSTRG